MKIKKLETFTKPFVSFVKITDDNENFGYGQMSTYHADITAQIFHKQVAPWVLGKSWHNFDDILNLILEREHKIPWIIYFTSHCWIRYSFMGYERSNRE